MSQYEVTAATEPAEVTAGWIDQIYRDQPGRPYWAVEIPGPGEVWSTDRAALSGWLRAAADRVDALPPAAEEWPEQGPAPDPWADNRADTERSAA